MNHKRPFVLSVIFFFFSLTVFSQEKTFSVDGKVVDKSGQPLAGASVFCQNTTIGTLSKNDGSFHLRLANGGYDLIVSFTGYQTESLRIGKDHKETDTLQVTLKAQDKSLEQAVVTGSALVADGWNKYGQFFLDNFIGTTTNATQCTIENKDSISFYFYKKRNKLKVKAKSEIIITNLALGYKIRYQLDSFVNDYNTHISSYTGYPLFENLPGTAEQVETWGKNRYRTYIGSRLHFMRSYY